MLFRSSNFLCVNDKGEPLNVDYISHKFKSVFDKFIEKENKKALKENKEFKFPYITYHKLRHLNITALLKNGAELIDVKDNAGHSNINTTLHYTHQYTQNKQQLAQKIDEVFAPYIKLN